MKSILKKSLSAIAGTLLVSVFVGASLSVSAQDEKPKGKPWPAPESAIKMKSAVKSDDASIQAGKELYAQHCKSCHGAKGKGDGTKAENIDISCGDFTSEEFAKVSDGEAFWKTTEGRKPMPSFKEKLGDNDRWSIINYLRTLQGK